MVENFSFYELFRLVCAVSYKNQANEKMFLRKYFKFPVTKPIDVKTKFYNAEVSFKYVLSFFDTSLITCLVVPTKTAHSLSINFPLLFSSFRAVIFV